MKVNKTSSVQKYVDLLLYVSLILYRKFPPQYFLTYLYLTYCELKKRKQIRFYNNNVMIPSPNDFINHYLKQICVNYRIDENNCILTPSESNVIDKNDLFHFVQLRTRENTVRFVHFVPMLFNGLKTNEVYIPETLFTNLKYTRGIRVDTNRFVKTISIAKNVEIALINTYQQQSNETNSNSICIDTSLNRYFQIPRLLYKNDVFAISIEEYAPEFQLLQSMAMRTNLLHFKCKCISSDVLDDDTLNGYLCVRGETTLRLSANVRAYLPPSCFQFTKCGVGVQQSLFTKCPYGLEKFYDRVQYAVKPFLSKKKSTRYNCCNPIFLIQGRKGLGKVLLVELLASKFGMHLCKIDCSDIQSSTSAQTESKLRNVFLQSKLIAPCILLFHNFEVFGRDNEGAYDTRLINSFQLELNGLFEERDHFPTIVICVSNTNEIDASLGRLFLETFQMQVPNALQRVDLLKWLERSKHIRLGNDLTWQTIAARTHGFAFADLDALLSNAITNHYTCLNHNNGQVMCTCDESNHLQEDDIYKALDKMQKSYTSEIGAASVPTVLWSDVGGHENLKREIIRTINLPIQHPKLLLQMNGLKRSGILLYGPPGTGKTLIAKAVATECGLCFLSVKGPELLNMYVGQSEQNVRHVFERAREASPCIIFFDELDSLAPNRGISGDSGGVMDRVVSQLLAEMDGLSNDKATVFIIAATNRPDLIDPALLRPGRFDKLLYVGPCIETQSKVAVFQALTHKFNLSDDVNFETVSTFGPRHVTGADLYAVCSDAWLKAVRRTIHKMQQQHQKQVQDENDHKVCVHQKDFISAMKKLKPSISEVDLQYYHTLQSINK